MGRVHLEWPVFRSRNNPSLFQQIFGILELLQPHLFASEFHDSLESILNCYLNLFKVIIIILNIGLFQDYILHQIDGNIS